MRQSMAILLPAALVAALTGQSSPPAPRFTVVDATIAEMQAAMDEGRTTSREIVQQSLTRIALYEDRLNAAITVNPRALEEADGRDRERRQGRIRGPLHGIPIALIVPFATVPPEGAALPPASPPGRRRSA